MIHQIIISILEIFGIFGLGFLARHLGYIQEIDIARWSKLIIDILFPFLIFSSIIKSFDPSRLNELWLMPLIGFGLMLFGALTGIVLKRFLRTNNQDLVKTFHFFTAVNNYGFLPLIIVKNCWGEGALPLLFLLNLGSSIGFWTIGIAILGGEGIKKSLKNLITPSLIALLLSLVLSMVHAKAYIPAVFINISSSVGNISIPFILLLIGASMYNSAIVKVPSSAYYLVFCRNLLIPVATIAVLKLLTLPQDAYNVAFIVSIMPASVSSVVITQRFGGCPKFAAQCAILTTLSSLLTIPLLMKLL